MESPIRAVLKVRNSVGKIAEQFAVKLGRQEEIKRERRKMNESGRKRREWVKTAAIVFLAAMLILTFFSNTFMNYSLPEVATQYVQSGSITAKIRGTGVIESGDPYNVEVTESRKVASVAVRVGTVVQKGDVLVYLENEESKELQAAQKALEAAQEAYDKALLNTSVTASDIAEANSGVTAQDFRKQITDYQNAIKVQENKIAPLEAKIAPMEAQIANLEEEKAGYERFIADIKIQLGLESASDTAAQDRVTVTQKAAENAKTAMEEKAATLQSATSERDEIAAKLEEAKANSESDSDAAAQVPVLEEQLKSAQEAVTKANENYTYAEKDYNTAVTNHEKAQKELAERNSSQTTVNLKEQQAAAELQIYTIEKAIEDIEKQIQDVEKEIAAVEDTKKDFATKLDELEDRMSIVLGLGEQLEAIAEAQAEVDELIAKTIDATITAPVSGTITTINVTAGESTSTSVPVVVMQPEGKGCTLSFSVTNEQAKKLSVGDKADLVNAWRYQDVAATLASITVDKNNPSTQKVLTFNVTGSVVAGQSLTLSVGQKSANYDYIVPNSAIREDNNGQFILIVESKASPLGTRYTASRVDVQVVASDDTQSAITGGVYGYEFVITTSTKPVQAGELVRLAD